MLKRLILLSLIMLTAACRPMKVSAQTPEERFDSLMVLAASEDKYNSITRLQEALELCLNHDINDTDRIAKLHILIGEYYLIVGDYERAGSHLAKAEVVLQDYPEASPFKITLKLLQCSYLETISNIEAAIAERSKLAQVIENKYGRYETYFSFYRENAESLLMDYLLVGESGKALEIYKTLPDPHQGYYFNRNFYLYKTLFHLSREEREEAFDSYRKHGLTKPDDMLCSLALDCKSSEYPEFQRKSIESKRKSVIDNVIHFAETQYSNEALGLLTYLSEFIPSLNDYPQLTGDFFSLNLLRKGLSIHAVNELKRMAAQTEAGRNALAQIECINDSIREFSAGNGARLTELQLRLEQCQRKLHTLVPDMDELRSRLNKGASDAYKALPEKAVGIDFIRYMFPDTLWSYGAFVYDGSGTTKFIELFGEDELLGCICKDSDDIDNDFFLDKSCTQLIWGKLLPIIEKYDEVYFSPDGLLTLSIEFLLTDDDTTVYDRYKLHRVFHLADIGQPVGLGDYFAAFGVSRYNNSTQDDSGQIVADLDRGSFVDLPGVDKELENICNAIAGSREHIRVSCIKDAEERQVLDFSGIDVTAMHFACHGFYIFSSDMEEAAADPSNQNYNISRRMHYYRQNLDVPKDDFSGLLLRNGNSAWNSTSPLGRHDDLLTAEEVSDMYFPNLNLTVLSACESGFGVVVFDGVMGLQRAFRKAGTRNLICSLIRVNDNITSDFMTTFYTLAARGATVRDAFVEARRRLQEDYPRRPDYWAAWILIE